MSTRELDRPVVTADALRSANFFNGRLLTGEDLRREQEANEARLRRVGRAGGEGVAYGLEVAETPGVSTNAQPVVTVGAGLAVCRSGHAVELGADVDVALARPSATATSEPGGLFADCQPFAPGTYTAGTGVYLLTIAPARQGEGRAPVSGLSNDPAPCNVALSVDAVRFRLIRLALPASELAEKPRLRNRVAYRFFAPVDRADVARDPWGGPLGGGLLGTLRRQVVRDDEVPLAVVGWSFADGIQFVDLWAVRRRVRARGTDERLGGLFDDDARAGREAMIAQFQAHLADLRRGDPASVEALERFDRLPPFGLVPLAVSAAAGFDLDVFFAGLTTTPARFVEGSHLEHLADEALGHPPIELAADEAIRVYLVRENQQAAGPSIAPYASFVNGHVPYAADARWDLAICDYANYAEL
jgi:hypothetical protein